MKNVRKISVQGAAILLLLVVFFASCEGKKSESASAVASAAEREPYNVDIYGHAQGTFAYIVSIAIAELVNEKSSWIRMTAVESQGSGPNELMMLNASDEQRRHTIFQGVGDNAWRGTGSFAGKQTKASKIAFNVGVVYYGIVSNNPGITKLEDFTGRSLGIRSGNSAANPWWIAMIDEKVPNVKYERMDMSPSVEASLSGALDGWMPLFYATTSDFKKGTGNPATVEYLSRAKQVNFINYPMDVDQRIRAIPGGEFENFFMVVATVPPGAADPRQTQPWNAAFCPTLFMVDESFPEEVLYEVVKIIGENNSKLASYHPLGSFITPQTMATYSYPPEFHPGAVKYYNEVGVTPTFLGDLIEQAAKQN